jgi:DNA-binding transcriptional LysR family regulator
MTMDWLTTMEVFVRVVETGSFSGAARLLHVGQPATSKTIAQLERRLGVTLLLRSSRGLTAEAILDDRDVELIEEGIDVGFLMGMLADSTMVARKIGQSRRLVLGTPSYFKKAGEPSTPAELADHQAVIFDLCPNRGRSTWSFRSGATEQTVTLKGNVRTTAAEGLREPAVFAGLGLCVASEWMFQPDLGNGRVTQVLPDWTLPSMDLWATFPTGRRASAKARAFTAFVEDQLRQTNFAEQPSRRASTPHRNNRSTA